MYQLKVKSIVTKCFQWVGKDGVIWYWDVGDNSRFTGNKKELNRMIDIFKSIGYTEFEVVKINNQEK